MLAGLRRNKKPKPELQSWYRDRYQHVLLQRKLLAFISLLALATTLVMVVIITQLIPLKTIEPYVIQVDSRSGVTQTVDPLTARDLTTNEVVNNYFLVKYLRSREGYSASDVMYQYDLVRLMSSARSVYPDFVDQASPNNPQSNIARLGAIGNREVRVKSISYISPQVAQIRFDVIEQRNSREEPRALNRIALIGFEYVKMTLTTKERYLNPLGFRVTSYQLREDVP